MGRRFPRLEALFDCGFQVEPEHAPTSPGHPKVMPEAIREGFHPREIVADVSKSFPGAPEIDSGTPELCPRASEMSSGASDLSSGASEIGPRTSEICPRATAFSPRTLEFSSGASEFCPSSEGPISRRGWFKDGGLQRVLARPIHLGGKGLRSRSSKHDRSNCIVPAELSRFRQARSAPGLRVLDPWTGSTPIPLHPFALHPSWVGDFAVPRKAFSLSAMMSRRLAKNAL